jgi:hypothetical protein
MSSPKEKLRTETEETVETGEKREVYLRDGRTLVVSDEGAEQLVEIRNESGMLELKIKLTEQGPVLQMESVRLQLKATEALEIESKRIDIKATETVAIRAEEEIDVEAAGDVRVVGKKIWLN